MAFLVLVTVFCLSGRVGVASFRKADGLETVNVTTGDVMSCTSASLQEVKNQNQSKKQRKKKHNGRRDGLFQIP